MGLGEGVVAWAGPLEPLDVLGLARAAVFCLHENWGWEPWQLEQMWRYLQGELLHHLPMVL